MRDNEIVIPEGIKTRITPSEYFKLASALSPADRDLVPAFVRRDRYSDIARSIRAMAQLTIPGQALPPGGTTGTQPVPPTPIPQSIEDLVDVLTPTVARFRAASSQLTVPLDQAAYTSSALTKQVRIASVGLGFRIISKHVITFNIANNTGGAYVVLFSPHFPFNIIGNTQVKINGGAQVYSVGGLNGLNIAMRDRRGGFIKQTNGGFGPAINQAFCQISTTGITITNGTAAVPTLSGIASGSIANGVTATVTATFYTFERLSMDRTGLLGALPLQSNSTFATITRALNNTFMGVSSDARTPFSVSAGTVPATLVTTLGTATTDSDYWFASIPPQSELYAEMIANSYQCIEQTALPINSNATQSFKFTIDQNELLAAIHNQFFDSLGVPLTIANIPQIYLQYNAGTIQPAVYETGRNRAYLAFDYGDDRIFEVPGYRTYNGYESTESLTETDQQQWLDTYFASQPQFLADISGVSNLPANVNVATERVVIGGTNVIGG